jgi:hypothetical protein
MLLDLVLRNLEGRFELNHKAIISAIWQPRAGAPTYELLKLWAPDESLLHAQRLYKRLVLTLNKLVPSELAFYMCLMKKSPERAAALKMAVQEAQLQWRGKENSAHSF